MDSPLFRPEAVAAQTAQHLGTIRIGRLPGHTTVAVVALALAGALVAFAAWGEITRKVRVPGILMPEGGILQIAAPAAGTIAELRVAEGQTVSQGQVLFVLATDRAGPHGDTAALVARSLQQRRATLEIERALRETSARQRQQALADRLRSMQNEVEQGQSEVRLAHSRVELADRNVDRVRQLAAAAFVSVQQVQAREEEAIEARARQQAAQRNVLALEREQRATAADLAAARTLAQTDLAQVDRSLAGLDQEGVENDARKTVTVAAPRDGVVTSIPVRAGQFVLAGQAVATMVGKDDKSPARPALTAELFAPSRAAGFIRTGQKVWLRYSAYPYQTYGFGAAEVASVSATPVNAQDLPAGHGQALLAALGSAEPVFRIVARLVDDGIWVEGRKQPLAVGMSLEADLVRDRLRVWEWFLAPLRHGAASMPSPVPTSVAAHRGSHAEFTPMVAHHAVPNSDGVWSKSKPRKPSPLT